MKYKIKSLFISNFKCIETGKFEFKENNLVVLDGPNGYGKTTIFDAIEILLTGIPRRIRDSKNIIKNYSFSDSPIHKDPDQNIELEIVLQKGDNLLTIKKLFAPASTEKSITNNPQKIFEQARTFVSINDEKVDPSKIQDFLKFENLGNLYNVLNYIEQDENTYFLKKNPKEKYKDLVALLGVEKQLNKLRSVKSFRKNIQKLLKRYQENIDIIEKEDLQITQKSSEKIKYLKLLKTGNHYWDKEEIEINNLDSKNEITKELNKVKYLIQHLVDLENITEYNKFNEFSTPVFINSFLQNFWNVAHIEELEKDFSFRSTLDVEKKQIEKIQSLMNGLVLRDLAEDEILITLKNLPNYKFDKEKFMASAKIIETLKESLSLDFQILEEMKSKREVLTDFYFKYQEKTSLNKDECPTCGFQWESNIKLIEEIKKTEERLFSNYEENNSKLENEKKSFQEFFLDPLMEALNIRKGNIDENLSKLEPVHVYTQKLQTASSLKNSFRRFLKLLNKTDVKSISNKYLSNRTHNITEEDKDFIKKIITSNRPNLNNNIKYDKLLNDFSSYFGQDLEEVKKTTIEDINKKEKYIEYRYLSTVHRNLNNLKQKKRDLVELEVRSHKLENIYDQEIKDYVTTIVRKITIPFYIYTGKILQQHSLGSGLIFDADIDRKDPQIKIRPLYSEQEVSYTLSSGQQAATVISLLIVLNKVYGNSEFAPLLIDDPLQTLDEINTHSLVEVLKYNFSDQQIILSTHEDRYSKFFRYKFGKFGLSHSNINLRDRYHA